MRADGRGLDPSPPFWNPDGKRKFRRHKGVAPPRVAEATSLLIVRSRRANGNSAVGRPREIPPPDLTKRSENTGSNAPEAENEGNNAR